MARAPASIGVIWSRPRGSACDRHNRETANIIMKSVDLYRITQIGILVCTLNVYGQEGSNNVEQRVNSILSQLTLDEKISYIGGTPFFDVKPIPLPNLQTPLNPQIFQTDAGLGERNSPASVRYPSGLVLAATFNRDRATDAGAGLGRDTRARGFFSILGPGMDFYRTPYGGRNFEYMTGEDPYLGSQLIPKVIQAIQEQGVWACAKHYVCNDQEENRTNINEIIDERTLREIYLPPFEAAVKEGHTATVMGAYNFLQIGPLPSAQCNESSFLLTNVLKNEWGFTGFVMSDYNAIHNGVNAYLAGCDLDLPNGQFMNSSTLEPLIENGTLPESILNDKVRRILREVISFGFLDRQQLDSSIPLDDPQSEQAALDTAREGVVLLKNDGNLLPLQRGRVRTVAVVGPAAIGAPPTGFGSSTVFPISYVPELDGIESEAPAGTEVDFISDCTPEPTTAEWQTIDALGEAERGLQGQYFTTPDLSGTPATTRVDNDINFDWEQDPIPVTSNQGNFSAKWTGQFVPQISGDQVIKVCADGGVRVLVNGQILIDNFSSPPLPPVGYGPTPGLSAKFSATAGTPCSVELDYHRVPGFFGNAYGGRSSGGRNGGLLGVQLSWASLQAPQDFAKYDAVVVCVGTNNQYDGEGYDRPFDLPEFQGELIQNLANVNPRTIVITHGGGSFNAEPWINQVRGLIQAFYPGQNGGQAIAEILFGAVNPSGKLPISWEKLAQDNPAFATFPMPLNQLPTTIDYSEGIFIGYRGYEKNHIQPLFPFGFGLSYTSFAFSNLKIEPAVFDGQAPVTVSFTVTNTGKRAGAEVAELYVGQQSPTIVRPIKELKGFEKVNLNPGQSSTVTLSLDQRSFAYFNTTTEKWDAVPGVYNVVVGDSSDNTPLKGQVTLKSEFTANP
jgi:beta-glucosidase